MNINQLMSVIDGYIWGPPLMILLVGTGLFLTLRFCFVQVRGFRHGINILSGKYDRPDDPGEVSHFKALSSALSATIGTGNIVGVAAAILLGGPGAVFWMWVAAFFGMASKFTCCSLAVHFRKVDEKGEAHGGPMYYIEMGLGPKFKFLAVAFAVFTVFTSFGMGNMFQINNITSSIYSLVTGSETALPGLGFSFASGLVFAVLVGIVIIGGIRRIAGFASKIVPLMCIIYVLFGLIILLKNFTAIPHAFYKIFYYAFHAPEAIAGGVLGGVIRQGIARGLFSNEAGLGSAAMAHGAAKTKEPVREGMVAMLGPFIDTIMVCSITALVIIITGAHETIDNKGLLTSAAFGRGIPYADLVVKISVVLFAFSTLVAWSYYGDRAADYLFGPRAVMPYRFVYVIFIVLGACLKLDTVINFCDAMNGLMAVPNLIALLALSGLLLKLTKDYFKREVSR